MGKIACLYLPLDILRHDFKDMVISLLLFLLNDGAANVGVAQFGCSDRLVSVVRVVAVSLELGWEVLSVFEDGSSFGADKAQSTNTNEPFD